MVLSFVRHCITQNNAKHVMTGVFDDSPLSEAGCSQAAGLGKWFQGQTIDVIYSSPLLRATQTASAIGTAIGLNFQTCGELIERDLGEYDGLRVEELKHVRISKHHAFTDVTQDWYGVSGVEPDSSIYSRVSHLIEKVSPKAHAIFVTHAGVIKAFLHSTLRVDPTRGNYFAIKNGIVLQLSGESMSNLKLILFCDPTVVFK